MEVFEIHITGDEGIHKAAEFFDYKTIAVDLLKPNGSFLRREHMTSVILKANQLVDCLLKVSEMVGNLAKTVQIYRTKVESPYYSHYVSRSLYMETHFESKKMDLPTSKNQRKTKLLATDRTYNKHEYDAFREKYAGKELELCLLDTNVTEDADWFELYKGK